MTIVSKLHVRNVEFMTLTPFGRNAWRLVPNYFGGYPWEPKLKKS
jgi:hypothetical protein